VKKQTVAGLVVDEEGLAEPPRNCQLNEVGFPNELLVNEMQSPTHINVCDETKLATGGTQLFTVIETVDETEGHELLFTVTV
jgi:hypothetical protein